MKTLVALVCAALLAGTGCAHREAAEAAASADAGESREAPAAASRQAPETSKDAELILGVWTSGSCAKRGYLRRIELRAGGRFVARDAVAPCPQGAQCAWSGVIDWAGGWSLEEGLIELDIEPGQRLPDRVPDRFVVMKGETPRIAEQTGAVVCPYRRAP